MKRIVFENLGHLEAWKREQLRQRGGSRHFIRQVDLPQIKSFPAILIYNWTAEYRGRRIPTIYLDYEVVYPGDFPAPWTGGIAII